MSEEQKDVLFTPEDCKIIEKIISEIIAIFPNRSILIVGQPPNDLFNYLKTFSNIHITGKVIYNKVPEYISSAK